MSEITLKLTAAVALGGVIHRAGSQVQVSDADAKNLLRRGKAELIEEDGKPADAPEGETQANAEHLAAVRERALKDQDMTAEQFDALSKAKRNALLKQAEDALAAESAA